MGGKVENFKAKLVANNYAQRERVDYEETFSHVAMLKSIRIFLSIVVCLDYEISQMNVKIVSRNGYLEESTYMVQPKGVTKGQVYRLTQASKSLNLRFDKTIKTYNFKQNVDELVFTR